MFAPVPFFGRGGDPPPLRVRLVHKRSGWDVVMDARATFGELRVRSDSSTQNILPPALSMPAGQLSHCSTCVLVGWTGPTDSVLLPAVRGQDADGPAHGRLQAAVRIGIPPHVLMHDPD